MTILSNLYVEKASSEHPIAIWMLNEQVDYISLITETEREFENASEWTLTNATASAESPLSTDPIQNSHVSRIIGNSATLGPAGGTIAALSVDTFPLSSFVSSLGNVSLAFYMYFDNDKTTNIRYGYQYFDTSLSITVEVTETATYQASDLDNWRFFATTFDLPPITATNIKLLIETDVSSGGGIGDYDYLINGLSFGQWSENFHYKSLGVIPELVSSNSLTNAISIPNTLKYIEAVPYGTSGISGYYLAKDELYANNYGIPLVFGSSNVTKIYPNVQSSVSYPSLIFPGYGFLNEKGRFNEYTAEMWIRVNTDSIEPHKIFGPIASNDGLYVEGGFLTLVLNNKYISHYVGEWMRPMLVHIRYIKNNMSMLVNGEFVGSFEFDENDIELPTEFDGSNKSQDWVGFYAHDDVHPIDIDSYAIYSYQVATNVAKRRFVWGQGVVAPEQTNSALNANTAFVDYAYSNYSVNYNYPDFANWQQAYFSNLITTKNFLQLPNYNLPIFNLDDKTQDEWYDDMLAAESAVSEKYFSFRPNGTWSGQNCSIFFKGLNVLNERIETVYGIFESDGTAVNEPLFKIQSRNNNNFLLVKINGTTVTYSVSIKGVSTTIATKTITANQKFTVGINITNLSNQPIAGIREFLSNQTRSSLYIAGDGTTTFTGKLYRFGFDAKYNNRKINTIYDTAGIFSSTLANANIMLTHTANYTLKTISKYGIFFADIAVAAYWEDYVPLTYFAKYTEDYKGERYYDLDMLQLNLDFPEPLETSSIEFTEAWTYGELKVEYETPVQLTYAELDNNIYTGWDDYEDMAQQSVKYYYYNTEQSALRSYISFQKIADGANKNLVEFTHFDTPRVQGVIDPNFATTNWEDTAFEFVDGQIVYPPLTDQYDRSIPFEDLAVVVHLDFKSEGILHHPVSFRDLQLASLVLNREQLTEVGTKFGLPVYPYYKVGNYYEVKSKNPYSIYKGSTPHLYLNRHTGIRIRGQFDPIVDRGVRIPINPQTSDNIKISALQLWLRYSDRVFPTGETEIFNIDFLNNTYYFYLTGDSSTQRGYITVKDQNGVSVTDLEFYISGIKVDVPYLNNEEWEALGIAFPSLVDFSGQEGSISLNGPLTYNNIAYYLATNLQQTQSTLTRTWGATSAQIWDYWENDFTWQTVLALDVDTEYFVNPSEIYDKYVGTNRIIVDDNVNGVLFDPEKFTVFGETEWQTSVRSAV